MFLVSKFPVAEASKKKWKKRKMAGGPGERKKKLIFLTFVSEKEKISQLLKGKISPMRL